MSEIKRTPGPWQQYANGSQVYGGDGKFITSVQSENSVEDARLIAAAPELLEALTQLVRPYGVADVGMANAPTPLQMEFIDTVRKAKAVISKVTGGPKC